MSNTSNNTVIKFDLNGQEIQALAGETILQVAHRHEIDIPFLCFKDGYRADGNCRSCVVEIDGERTLAPSCCRYPSEGMKVKSNSKRALASQKMVIELLKSDTVDNSLYTKESELDYWARKLAVDSLRFKSKYKGFEATQAPKADLSNPAIAVNLDACIQCTRCVRACREEQVNDVIGYAGRGHDARIVFDMGDSMGASTCVSCGECVQACPTGALMPADNVGLLEVDKKVDSTCPYCGVGCLLTYHVKDNKIIKVSGRDGPSNLSRLCVKGRYGFDYINHPHRLTKPLIRLENAAKVVNMKVDPANPFSHFREASWQEALELTINKLKNIRDTNGPKALAGFGSAKGSNEEAYLFQKLVRTGFGSNNVDHCTRLCHASSVAALLEGVGSGAVSNQVKEVKEADLIMILGSNTTGNHPVAATFIKNAAQEGKTLIVMDPRKIEIARHADYFLQFTPDSDVAMLNAMIYTIIEEDLIDKDFISQRVDDFDKIKESIASFSPEKMQDICGIDAPTLREVARKYAGSKGSMIFWGMGVSQHIHGTDNVRCLITLAMITGQIGKPGTGLHPLRGQNNVQGASDAGLIPMVYPDYQRVDDPKVQAKFEQAWGVSLDNEPGLTVVEIMHAADKELIKGMYIMGENPAMSDPNLNHARHALCQLDHLVVQDIFLTETAFYADVVLPASAFTEKTGTFSNTDRRVQLGRKAVNLPGQARQDLEIIIDIANGLGCDWHYKDVSEVYEEMRLLMPTINGITWDRLEKNESVTYPCENAQDKGQGVVFIDSFPTQTGKSKLVPTSLIYADEQPDNDYPFILITGRQLEHWHTGSMTRRASKLDAIEPTPHIQLSPKTMYELGIEEGQMIKVKSRRGELIALARENRGLRKKDIFIPFCYHEAAANMLTNEALDPFGKIPEFKYCAVTIETQMH